MAIAEFLAPVITPQFFSNSGQPLVGGQLFTYQAGTSTPSPTYVDSTGLTPNTNPIILNSRGECSLWIPPNTFLKFVLEDPNGNVIWTRDFVSQSVLLSLFGGVDTGSANTYILNFNSPNTAYVNGWVIYWIPANSNTGPSTLNVNGLGVIPIVTVTGAALGAGQLIAGVTATVMYYNGVFQLVSVSSFSGSTVGVFGAEIPLASSTTVDLGSTPNHNVAITGTVTVTGFGSSASIQAPIYIVRFTGSLTLTNSSSLILPGNANIVTQAGDSLMAEYAGSGVWRVLAYFPATGVSSNNKIKPGDSVITSSTTLTPDPDLQSNSLGVGRYFWSAFLIFDSVSAGAGFKWTNGGSAVDSRGLAPANGLGFVNAGAYGPKLETPYGNTISYATVSTGPNSNEVLYTGSLLVSTVGTFGISWAQASSTGSATTLRAGSYLSVTLANTGTSAGGVVRVFTTPGSFTETVPAGFNTLTIEVWGGSGGGGARFISGAIIAGGGGAASGSYARTTISVTGLAGDTILYTVGVAGIGVGAAGGASSVSSGGGSPLPGLTTISAPGGLGGANATAGNAPGAGGSAPANATGGTVVNTAGNPGSAGQSNAGGQNGGVGGFGIPGIFDGGASGGPGSGIVVFTPDGGVGIVVFSYSV